MLSVESILEAYLDENMLPDECSLIYAPDPAHIDPLTSTSVSSSAMVSPDAKADASHADPQLSELILVSSAILKQAFDLVDGPLTDDNQLTVQSKYLPGSTIGKHLRHARDHFVLLIDCVTGSRPYVLSYDARSRNTPMESCLSEARAALESTMACLEKLKAPLSVSLDQAITLNAVTPYSHTYETTFGRELWFAALHAIHHWSVVRVIAGELGILLPEDFGVAPSTLVYKGCDVPLGKAKI